MGSNSILDALLGASQEGQSLAAAENPYAPYAGIANEMSNAVQQQGVSEKYGTGQTLLAAALSGLISGGLNQAGTNYTNKQSSLYNQGMQSILGGNELAKPEGINENLFKKLQEKNNLFSLQKKLEAQSEESELKKLIQTEAAKTLVKTPKGANDVLQRLFGVQTNEAQPIVKPQEEVSTNNKKLKTIEQLRREAGAEADSLDITPGDKADYIGKVMTPITKQSERFQKELEEKSAKQRDLELTLKGAEDAVSKAGATGTVKGTIGGFIDRNILAPLGNEGAKERNAADAVLNQLQQAGIKENKVPGAGSISDFESKKIFEASPGTGNTPEHNQALIAKMSLKNDLDKDYLGFMNNWLDTFGTKKGAEQGWNTYKDAAQVIIQDWDGTYTINPNRPDWRDLDLQSLVDAPTVKSNSSVRKENVSIPTMQKMGKDGSMYNVRDLGNGQYEILE